MLAPASDMTDPGWSRRASCYGADRLMPIAYVSEPPAAADLVIVGGGIVGAATAFHASRAGLRPLVLERRPALSTLTTAAVSAPSTTLPALTTTTIGTVPTTTATTPLPGAGADSTVRAITLDKRNHRVQTIVGNGLFVFDVWESGCSHPVAVTCPPHPPVSTLALRPQLPGLTLEFFPKATSDGPVRGLGVTTTLMQQLGVTNVATLSPNLRQSRSVRPHCDHAPCQ